MVKIIKFMDIDQAHVLKRNCSKQLTIRGLRLSCAILKFKPCKQTFFFYFIRNNCKLTYEHDSCFASAPLAPNFENRKALLDYSAHPAS